MNGFFQGLVLGFSIAVPVGPIGVLCLRRSIAEGALVGFLCGLGAATADAIYGAIGALGLTLVTDVLVRQQVWLALLGGLFLCYLGVKTGLSQPAQTAARNEAASWAGAFGSTLLLTLTNPMTILSFAGLFASFGLGSGKNSWSAVTLFVTGVFAGSAAWWLVLSVGAWRLASRFGVRQLQWLNRSSGAVLFGLGFWNLSKLNF
jgi:threonine/homoserine/homoserine lactone efflux protein